jgi:hypothetical protein
MHEDRHQVYGFITATGLDIHSPKLIDRQKDNTIKILIDKLILKCIGKAKVPEWPKQTISQEKSNWKIYNF